MTGSHKKIANGHHENDASFTSRDLSKHGLSKAAREYKKLLNRRAKKIDANFDLASYESE